MSPLGWSPGCSAPEPARRPLIDTLISSGVATTAWTQGSACGDRLHL